MKHLVLLSAEPVEIAHFEPQNAADLVLLMHAVRATRLDRHDLHVPRVRAVDGGHTTARERVERIEREVGGGTSRRFRRSLHVGTQTVAEAVSS